MVHDRGTIALDGFVEKPVDKSAVPRDTPTDRLMSSCEAQEEEKLHAAVAQFPVERLGEAELRLAEDFLRCKDELANRAAPGGSILRMLCDKMGRPTNKTAHQKTDEPFY